MFIFQAKKLSKEWHGKQLFQDADLELKRGEHLALYGKNGSGKTTLLNGLSGRFPFDSGTVQRQVPVSQWAMLEQSLDTPLSVKEFVATGSPERKSLKKKLNMIEQQMTDPENYQDDQFMSTYSHTYDTFVKLDGFQLDTDVETCLREVSLDPAVWESPAADLSGGQKTRVQLAKILLQKPDCLLMDEPTNHLDQQTIEWLETWLQAYKGAVLYVSHDRYFLDRTAHAIIELTPDGTTRYTGGYSDYKQQKELERRTQEAQFRKQEQKRKELMETINRYEKWFHQAHKAAGQNDFARSKAKKNVSRFKAKEKELERLDSEQGQKPQQDKRLNMTLASEGFSGKKLLGMEHVTFSYEHSPLFDSVNLTVSRGDRLVVMGPNGSGKTTLLKLMIGELCPDSGGVKLNPQTQIGYFAQELDHLQEEQTILDYFLSVPGMIQSEVRTLLGSFLFSRDAVFKRIGNLSMGEKCRIAFLKLYLSQANLLVLDEPTNFLDIDTRELIEDVLESYNGALVVVSHDRYLLQRLSNRIVAIENGEIEMYNGNYDDYLHHRKHSKRNPEEQARDNDMRQLTMALTMLMTADASELSAELQKEQIERIKEIRGKIRELEQKGPGTVRE